MNNQNHVNGVESLRDELDMLVKSKEDLEKRLQASLVERDALCASVDESRDRIHSLQKQHRDQEMKLQTTLKNLERVQRENDTLSERLESVNSFCTKYFVTIDDLIQFNRAPMVIGDIHLYKMKWTVMMNSLKTSSTIPIHYTKKLVLFIIN